ncbi:MAG TPA: hypothetical protein VKB27_19420 [Gammaproteobacteria bacterium]|nr:hypothetical protein [Gammaproteobacteria bacterium]
MTTIIFIVVALAIMIAIVTLYFKPYDYGKNSARLDNIGSGSLESGDTSEDTRWRSVKIRPGLIACKQATAIQQQIFPSSETPPLPLQGCGETDCNCHYIFDEDRRSGFDRRAEFDRLGRLLSGKREDRRRSRGRRIGDMVSA